MVDTNPSKSAPLGGAQPDAYAKRAAIRDPKDVPCDTVGNPADPDASYNAHKGQGYMAQIVETYCEDDSNEAVAATPDLITHVEVHKMTVHDGHRHVRSAA